MPLASDLDALEAALAPGGIRILYQPLVDLESCEVLGYEALARGPEGSPLRHPEALLATARRAGRLSEVDWRCRSTALEGALAAGMGSSCTLFVNVEADVGTAVPDALRHLVDGAAADLRIVLEVTEGAVVSRPAELLRMIRWARDRSWGIALDDVGANPLCLALMPFLEPDVIKLDLSLVQQRPTAEIGMIVSAVLAQAERTGASIVAEGIESEAHLEAAMAMGATVGQGWLYGPAAPLPDSINPAMDTIPLLRKPPPHTGETPFSVVRSARPLRRGSKKLLVGIAEHLEEQAMAWHDGPVILSTFEDHEELPPHTVERYGRLAGTGSLVVALGCGVCDEPAPGVVGTTLPGDHRLGDEWSVVVVGPHYAGALVARRRGTTAADAEPVWDFAVTHDRDLVVAAGRALLHEVSPITA